MEQLIRDLNSPANQGKPQIINELQRQIQQLQKQPSAWQSGLDLLNQPDHQLQFYGALTLSLKIEADWDQDEFPKDRDRISHLIELLVSNYVRLASNSAAALVITKLSGALAAVFAKPEAAWAHPPRHILACTIAGRYVPQNEAPRVEEMIGSAITMKGSALQAVLQLCLAMYERLVSDIWQLLYFTLYVCSANMGLSQVTNGNIMLRIDADEKVSNALFADCLQQVPGWCDFVSSASASAQLQSLFAQSFQLILHLLAQPSTAKDCFACIATMQAECPRLLTQAVKDYHNQINKSPTLQSLVEQMLRGEYTPESNAYMEYLQALVEQYDCTTDKYLEDPDAIVALERVQALSQCPGAAMVEDEVCLSILEMLSTIAEGYSEWTEVSQYTPSMKTLIKDGTLAVLSKVRVPNDQLDKQTTTWDEDAFTEFEDYRFQATNFFETAYSIFGAELLQSITDPFARAESSSWSEFDAVLFVLVSISDSLDSTPDRCDPSLNQIFSSQLWQHAVSPSSEVSGRIRWAVIKTISQYTAFLQRNSQHMISSLDFLFRCLQRKAYANQAAKAINTLCDTQRKFLVEALPQFLQTLVTLESITPAARQKVLSAVASLIQALPTEQERVGPLQDMIQLVQRFEQNNTVDEESDDPDDLLHSRMAMLASIAKGLQSPTDTPIDLDSPATNADITFWTDGAGNATQQAVLSMLAEVWNHLLDTGNADLVGYACEFLKAGFKEEHPCPFKFASPINTQLLLAMIDTRNANLDQSMSTASCFLASVPSTDPSIIPEINTIFNRVLQLTQECTSTLRANPTKFSAPSSILEFIVRTFNKHGTHIFSAPTTVDSMSIFFDYGLLTLRTPDTLPRRSAISFFATFLDLTDPSSKFMQDPTINANLAALLEKYSPLVLGLTIHFLAGECARSEIETFTTLLRTFELRQTLRAKKIMQEVMLPESGVLSSKALRATKPEQRARFVAQVEGLRGDKKTGQITREFWMSCRGGQFGYVT